MIMSTNYYLTFKECETCKRTIPPIHVGKRHGIGDGKIGFIFREYLISDDPHGDDQMIGDLVPPIGCWEDWVDFLLETSLVLVDEYGTVVDVDMFIDEVNESVFPPLFHYGEFC